MVVEVEMSIVLWAKVGEQLAVPRDVKYFRLKQDQQISEINTTLTIRCL